MGIASRPTKCLSGCPTSANRRGFWRRPEAGITLIELMIAVSIMGFVLVGALSFIRIGASTKTLVDRDVRYSQELSLMSDQIIDGTSTRYRGLREAADVTSDNRLGYTRYTFHFHGSDASYQEHYWAVDAVLYRSRGTEPPEQMGSANSIEVSGPDARGMCTLRLRFTDPGGHEVEHITSVRLRNHSR